jgi:FtsP/CotA-like multicopper oxidase with cupredoxin domain
VVRVPYHGPPGALGAPDPEPPPVAWYASRCIPNPLHGAGRFLVLTRGGGVERNLVRKDTVRIRTGEVMDILLDVSNPGLWMALCHIAEHAEAGMIFSFGVTPA